jgi:hypothetical protein
MKDSIKKILARYLPKIILHWWQEQINRPMLIQNMNADFTKKQKTILVSYITHPLERDSFLFSRHANTIECAQILKILINYDFKIDLINCYDAKNINLIRDKKYDVIFGLGDPFFEASLNNKHALKIIYLTESSPDWSKEKELERISYFYKRHHKHVPLTRSGLYYLNKHLKVADYAVMIGNKFNSMSYSEFLFNKIYLVSPTGLLNHNYKFIARNYKKTKKKFVWFGSHGAIHKGLDILVDVFTDCPDLNLFICGLSTHEEGLFNLSSTNISNLGFVDVNSNEFVDLVNECSFVILPSCSEGMSTSVITCMNHGLIPIVTRETGIDLDCFGYYLDDYKVEYVKDVVKRCSLLDDKILEEQHEKVLKYSRKKFNIHNFSSEIDSILSEIIFNE